MIVGIGDEIIGNPGVVGVIIIVIIIIIIIITIINDVMKDLRG